MKKVVLFFALIVGLLASASTAMAQTVNMNRYITLTVSKDSAIKLDFKAASAGTPVRIVSGSNTQDITVGTGWYDGGNPTNFTVTAHASTMTIYGDLTGFDCGGNGANITALDPSHNTQLTLLWCYNNTLTSLDVSGCTQLTELSCRDNKLTDLDVSKNTQLKELYCYGNKFTTAALNYIYCTLPDRTGKWNGVIQPVYSDTSSNNATVLATNKQNAIAKNWKVQYRKNHTDIPATTGTYVCGTLNTDSYITLTVAKDSAIRLDLRTAAEGTPVRIVSGSNTQDITVGTGWLGEADYTAGSTTMTVYGDIIGFDCNGNGANLTDIDVSNNTQLKELYCSNNNLSSLDVSNNTQLTTLYCLNNSLSSLDVSQNTQLKELNCHNNSLNSLDISHNTQLTKLYCYDNNFTTATLDDIYCALPDRTSETNGVIQPVYNSSSSNHATVLATNKQNAIAKNWKVQYYDDDTDIPATTGSYVCGTPHIELNMNSYITLTVKKDSAIRLDFAAVAAATPVRIVSGSNTQDITVGTSWLGEADYTAGSTTMTVYGDIIGFDCQRNGVNLTAIDVSHNTQLTVLNCHNNSLNSLDISQNTQLTELDCSDNPLGSLDVSHNTELKKLYCYNNQLSSLDVSNNTLLESIICYDNQLSSLDVSHNTQLKWLYCYGNNFTTQALDNIYCALPDRTDKDNGKIQPVFNSSDPNHATIIATNKQNATAKNWNVQYYYDDTDIPTTTGKHKCAATDIAEASAEQALTLYPNPVADVLYLSATARTIRIYNVYGIEVAYATDTDRVEVSHLPAGVYTVRADGTVAKMVKR